MITEINFLGLITALTSFLGIWLGHVFVRKIESISCTLRKPILVTFLLGLFCEFLSLKMETQWLSTIFGILGITLLWDALEFKRQEKRVIEGRSPANPSNPRHIEFLLDYPNSTVVNLINREPVGRPVKPDEAIHMVLDRRIG
jgi:putative Mn2+ efflux pump MntP